MVEKLKIYRGLNKKRFLLRNERGYSFKEESLSYIYIYKYLNSFFLTGSDNDEYIKQQYKRLKIENNELSLIYDYDSYSILKGNIQGDFFNSFFIDFNIQWHDVLFEKEGVDYSIKSLGLVGKKINESSFKGEFYNCFGDVLFQEDTFNLIHEVLPSELSENN